VIKSLSLIASLLFISACKPIIEQGSVTAKNLPIAQCIGSQSQCEITTELAQFTVKFSQYQLGGKVKTELPFVIEISQLVRNVKEPRITKVSAYLEGKEMFMGKVPVFFEKEKESNIFLAQSLLANCSEEQMVWRLWITVELKGREQTSFIDFTSQRL